MESFFSKLTDIGLRRLYKFILKRTIGIYLESELLIEQLHVSSRDGLVTLNDLKLSCDLINEDYLSGLPFKIVSFGISKLQGKLSYAAVLHDGCRFKANNIEIILEPTEIDEAKKEHESGKGEDRPIKTETKKLDKLSDELHFRKDKNFSVKNDIPMNVKGRTEEGQEGLNFLANWIEVVLDRLEISVEDVFLVIRDSKVSNTSFTLHLSKATFFNTNPRLLDSSDSTVAASLRMSQSQNGNGSRKKMTGSANNFNSVAALNSKSKFLKFENFELSISGTKINPNDIGQPSSNVFLKSTAGGYTSLNSFFRPVLGGMKGHVEVSDIDVHIPSILLELDELSVKSLLLLVSVLSPPPTPKSNSEKSEKDESKTEKTQWEKEYNIDLNTIPKATLRTLQWLENQSMEVGREGDEEESFSYSRLTEIMKNYLLSKKSFEENLHTNNMAENHHKEHSSSTSKGKFCDSDSGEDFPDNSDSDSEGNNENENRNASGDGSYEDSIDFKDALEGKMHSSIRRVKMGQSSAHNVTSYNMREESGAADRFVGSYVTQERDTGSSRRTNSSRPKRMDMSHSAYGARSIATMGSDMFHSTNVGPTSFSTVQDTQSMRSSVNMVPETRIRLHLAVVDVRLVDRAAGAEGLMMSGSGGNGCVGQEQSESVNENVGASQRNGDIGDQIDPIPVPSNTATPTGPLDTVIDDADLSPRSSTPIIAMSTSDDARAPDRNHDTYHSATETSAASVDSKSTTHNELLFHVESIIITTTLSRGGKDSSDGPKVSLSAGVVNVTENTVTSSYSHLAREIQRVVENSMPFISFQNTSDKHDDNIENDPYSKTLISAPHVEGSFQFSTSAHPVAISTSPTNLTHSATLHSPSFSLDLNLEPMVLSVRLCNVQRWKNVLDDIMGTLPPTKSHTKLSLMVNVPVFDMYLHCDSHFCAPEDLMNSVTRKDHSDNRTGQFDGGNEGAFDSESCIAQLLRALSFPPWDGKSTELLRNWRNIKEHSSAMSNSDSDEDDSDLKSSDRGNVNKSDNEGTRRGNKCSVISSVEYDHLKSSPAGFHIQADSVSISIDSNSGRSAKSQMKEETNEIKGKNDHENGKKPSNRTAYLSPKVLNSGTGLSMEVDKVHGKMFFAIEEKNYGYSSKFVSKDSVIEATAASGVRIGDERNKSREGKDSAGVRKVRYKEYSILFIKSQEDSLQKISLKNNFYDSISEEHSDDGGVASTRNETKANTSHGQKQGYGRDRSAANGTGMRDQNRGVHNEDRQKDNPLYGPSSSSQNQGSRSEYGSSSGVGVGSGDGIGSQQLPLPVIPFKDIFNLNAHVIDIDLGYAELNIISALGGYLSPPTVPPSPSSSPPPSSSSPFPSPSRSRSTHFYGTTTSAATSTPKVSHTEMTISQNVDVPSLSTASLPLPLPLLSLSSKASKKSSFGFILTSEMIRIRLTDNSYLSNRNHEDKGKKEEKCEELSEPFIVSLVVKNSNVKAFRSSAGVAKSFLSFTAEDLSVFDLTTEQSSQHDFSVTNNTERSLLKFSEKDYFPDGSNNTNTISDGKNSRIMPLLFGTTFQRNNVTNDYDFIFDENAACDGGLKYEKDSIGKKKIKVDAAILFQISVTEIYQKATNELSKSAAIYIEMNDVTHKHDPSSNFIRNIVKMLTPCTPLQVIQKKEAFQYMRENIISEKKDIKDSNKKSSTEYDNNIRIVGSAVKTESSEDDNCITNENSIDNENSADSVIDGTGDNQYALTRINIRMRKCSIDYECPAAGSRAFLSLGSISLSTTLANNANCYLLKSSVKDFVLHLSNQIMRNPLYEQNPLDIYGNRPLLQSTNVTEQRTPLFQAYDTNPNTHTNIGNRNDASLLLGSVNVGQVKRNGFSLDYDRFLDVHSFIQLLTVDNLSSLITVTAAETVQPTHIQVIKERKYTGDSDKHKNGDKVDEQNNRNKISMDEVEESERGVDDKSTLEKQRTSDAPDSMDIDNIGNDIATTSKIKKEGGGQDISKVYQPKHHENTSTPTENKNDDVTTDAVRTAMRSVRANSPPTGSIRAPSMDSRLSSSSSSSSSSMNVELSVGLFCVYVCMDSVDVLTMTAAEWMRMYQLSSSQVKRGEEDFLQASLLLERSDTLKKRIAWNTGARSVITHSTTSSRMESVNGSGTPGGSRSEHVENESTIVKSGVKGNQALSPSNTARLIGERSTIEGSNVIIKEEIGDEKQCEAVGGKAKSTSSAALNFGHVMTAAIIEEFYTAPPPPPVLLKPTPSLPPFTGVGKGGTVRTPSPEHGARWLPQYDYAGDTGDEGDDGFECCSDDSVLNEMDNEGTRRSQVEVEGMHNIDISMSHGRDDNKSESENCIETMYVHHTQNNKIEASTDEVSVLEESEWGLPCTDSFLRPELQSANTSKPDRAVYHPPAQPPVSAADEYQRRPTAPITPNSGFSNIFSEKLSENLVQNIDSDDDLSIASVASEIIEGDPMAENMTFYPGADEMTLLNMDDSDNEDEDEGEGEDEYEYGGDVIPEEVVDEGENVHILGLSSWEDGYLTQRKEMNAVNDVSRFNGLGSDLNNLNAFNYDESDEDSEANDALAVKSEDGELPTKNNYSSANYFDEYESGSQIDNKYDNKKYVDYAFNLSDSSSDNSDASENGEINEDRTKFNPDFDFDFDFDFNEPNKSGKVGKSVSSSRLVSSVISVANWQTKKNNIADSIFGFEGFASIMQSGNVQKTVHEDLELRTYGDFATGMERGGGGGGGGGMIDFGDDDLNTDNENMLIMSYSDNDNDNDIRQDPLLLFNTSNQYDTYGDTGSGNQLRSVYDSENNGDTNDFSVLSGDKQKTIQSKTSQENTQTLLRQRTSLRKSRSDESPPDLFQECSSLPTLNSDNVPDNFFDDFQDKSDPVFFSFTSEDENSVGALIDDSDVDVGFCDESMNCDSDENDGNGNEDEIKEDEDVRNHFYTERAVRDVYQDEFYIAEENRKSNTFNSIFNSSSINDNDTLEDRGPVDSVHDDSPISCDFLSLCGERTIDIDADVDAESDVELDKHVEVEVGVGECDMMSVARSQTAEGEREVLHGQSMSAVKRENWANENYEETKKVVGMHDFGHQNDMIGNEVKITVDVNHADPKLPKFDVTAAVVKSNSTERVGEDLYNSCSSIYPALTPTDTAPPPSLPTDTRQPSSFTMKNMFSPYYHTATAPVEFFSPSPSINYAVPPSLFSPPYLDKIHPTPQPPPPSYLASTKKALKADQPFCFSAPPPLPFTFPIPSNELLPPPFSFALVPSISSTTTSSPLPFSFPPFIPSDTSCPAQNPITEVDSLPPATRKEHDDVLKQETSSVSTPLLFSLPSSSMNHPLDMNTFTSCVQAGCTSFETSVPYSSAPFPVPIYNMGGAAENNDSASDDKSSERTGADTDRNDSDNSSIKKSGGDNHTYPNSDSTNDTVSKNIPIHINNITYEKTTNTNQYDTNTNNNNNNKNSNNINGNDSSSSSNSNSKSVPLSEQKAQWFVNPADVQVKQHHIPLPVKSDIKQFEDTLPFHERSLEVSLMVKLKAAVQIRVFGGNDWVPSPSSKSIPSNRTAPNTNTNTSTSVSSKAAKVTLSTTPMGPANATATGTGNSSSISGRREEAGSQQHSKRVGFSLPISSNPVTSTSTSPHPLPASTSSSSVSPSLQSDRGSFKSSQAAKLRELTDSHSSGRGSAARKTESDKISDAHTAVSDLLFERPDPSPSSGHNRAPRAGSRVSGRELEHMLDLSAKNVVVAVRFYAPALPHINASVIGDGVDVESKELGPSDSRGNVNNDCRERGSEECAGTDISDTAKERTALLRGNRGQGDGERENEEVSRAESKDGSDTPPLKTSTVTPIESTRPVLPVQRIMLSTEDLVLSFGRSGRRRRRVLGRWKDFNKRAGSNSASACDVPLLRLSLAGYETNSALSPPPSPPPPLPLQKTPSQSCTSGGADRPIEFNAGGGVDGHECEGEEKAEEVVEVDVENVDDVTEDLGLEYRASCSLLPLRCYLDAHFIYFLQDLHKTQQEILGARKDISKTPLSSSSSSSSRNGAKSECKSDVLAKEVDLGPYFQHVWIAPIMLKIDYEPGNIDLHGLQQGDYMQLLNFFPLNKMELCLRDFRASGVSGPQSVFMRAIESWVKDIYSNQMHQIICGAAPFRGLSNVGAGLHDLMLIPLKEFSQSPRSRKQPTPRTRTPISSSSNNSNSNNGTMMKELGRTSSALLHTATRDVLSATSKLTMMLARGILDLASDPIQQTPHTGYKSYGRTKKGATVSRTGSGSSGGAGHFQGYSSQREQVNENKSVRQPAGVRDGLEKALDSVTREVYSAVETVICVPVRDYTRTGPGGFLTSVVRALPIAVLRPTAGAAEALSYALLGMRNSIDPESKRDEEDIWNLDFDSLPTPKTKTNK